MAWLAQATSAFGVVVIEPCRAELALGEGPVVGDRAELVAVAWLVHHLTARGALLVAGTDGVAGQHGGAEAASVPTPVAALMCCTPALVGIAPGGGNAPGA
jgi:hypothetical protein